MTRRRDVARTDEVIERLRCRDLTLAEHDDPLLAGLLALSLSADVVAPTRASHRTASRSASSRSALWRSAFAGLATTALAGAALLFSGVGTPSSTSDGSPDSAPTASAESVAVTQLLDTAKADLDQAAAIPVAARAPLLAKAAAALQTAETQTKALPSDTERADLNRSAAQLHSRLDTSRKDQATQATSGSGSGPGDDVSGPTTSTAGPSPVPSPRPSSGTGTGTGPGAGSGVGPDTSTGTGPTASSAPRSGPRTGSGQPPPPPGSWSGSGQVQGANDQRQPSAAPSSAEQQTSPQESGPAQSSSGTTALG